MKRNFLCIVSLCLIPVFGILLSPGIDGGVRPKNKDINPDLRSQYAIIIGIDEYKNIKNLNNAVRDAKAVKKILIERYGYQESNIIDFYNEDANIQNIDSNIRLFADNEIDTNSLLIYFSGHGYLDESYDIGGWLPSDVGDDLNEEEREPLSDEKIVKRSTFKFGYTPIKGMMKQCKATHIFIIADSCYAGKLIGQGRNRSPAEELPKSYKKKSRQVLASGRGIVSDGEPGEHSPFAKFFIEYLEDNMERYIIGSKIVADLKEIFHLKMPERQIVGGSALPVGTNGGEFFLFYQYAEMVKELYMGYADLWVTLNNKAVERESKIDLCGQFIEDYKDIPGNEKIDKKRKKIKEKIQLLQEEIRIIDEMDENYRRLRELIGRSENIEFKIEECEKFLKKYKDAPDDKIVKKMIADINRNIGAFKVETMGRDYERLKKNLNRKDLSSWQKFDLCMKFEKKFEDILYGWMRVQLEAYIKGIEKEINREGDEKEIPSLNRIDFLQIRKFGENNPGSPKTEKLKHILVKKEKNLPPEKYWKSISKSNNGYYEREFPGGHIMVYIPEKNFWVDKYEVSVAQLGRFKTFRKKRKKSGRKLIRSLLDQHPAIVSFKEAKAYCSSDKNNKMRLLTNDEWEFIAGRNKGYKYSWGNEEVDAGGVYRANYDDSMYFRDGFNGPAPVRSFEEYSSPYGIVNLSGNVWEWVQGNKCKGGNFFSLEKELEISSIETGKILVGFRCVKEEVEK